MNKMSQLNNCTYDYCNQAYFVVCNQNNHAKKTHTSLTTQAVQSRNIMFSINKINTRHLITTKMI